MSAILPTPSFAGVSALPGTELDNNPTNGTFRAVMAEVKSSDKSSAADTAQAPAKPGMPIKLSAAMLSPDDQAKVRAKIGKTAKDFEAMFLGQMLEPMFAGIKSEGPTGGGHAEETWRSFLVQEFGNSIAKNGGVGIAKMIETQLLDTAGLSPKTVIHAGIHAGPAAASAGLPTAKPLPGALADPTRLAASIKETKA